MKTDNNAVVIVHPNDGIFVGECLGLGFWTLLETAGQKQVATFENEAQAKKFVSSWKDGNNPENYNYVSLPTVPSTRPYADIGDLIAAGIGHLVGDLPANEY